LAASIGKSRRASSRKLSARRGYPFFAVCIKEKGYGVSLQFGKLYRVIKPRAGDLERDFRVIDEEGEDYLYPAEWFAQIELSPKAKRRIAAAMN
jgi:hypothetical protein